MKLGRALLSSSAVFLLLGGLAFARPAVDLHLRGALVQKIDGKVTRKPVQGLTLRAGDVVEYSIDATNTGDQAAIGFSSVGPVPAHMEYVSGSAHAAQAAAIEYSIDGKTWSAHPFQIVKTPQGERRKPAAPGSYVSVRFTAKSALAPKATFHYTYEVVVK
ncbi:MAG TPA: hypothetical protein VJP85_14690 [Candidatus Baltobacteraceae bacterium]|nr:hypothetical protein [Candidatus Baltobacteraceae bacterium]